MFSSSVPKPWRVADVILVEIEIRHPSGRQMRVEFGCGVRLGHRRPGLESALRPISRHTAGLGQPQKTSVLDSQHGVRHIGRVGRTLMNSKTRKSQAAPKAMTAVQRGEAAAKIMDKELRAEHKRWNLPLLSWKSGKVGETWP